MEAVDLVSRAISNCRKQGVNKLLIDVTGLVDLPIPTLVDRFLMVEDWAQEAKRPCHDRIGGATRVHSSAKIRR